jgi:prepilin signal peptidase PulO-like enzyme (type II secretory pathway)
MLINFLIGLLVFIFGLCVGSFLNCAIYRIEVKKTLKGRSFCPHCKHNLSWMDLFPVFSFLLLGGKCRYCKAKISWQYPIVEASTAVIFLLIFLVFGLNFIELVVLFYIASSLIIIFVYDLKHYLIPDKILFPAIAVAFFYQLFLNFNFQILNYILAALIASGFFFVIWFFSKGEWMGFGDVKLAILMGFLLGLNKVLVALFLAFFFGAIIGIILMVFRKKGLKSEIPFGPFLITGTFSSMFLGNQIIQWYLNIFQI